MSIPHHAVAGLLCGLVVFAGPSTLRAQTLDSFNVEPNGFITSAASEAAGNIILGGQFSAISDTARPRIARLTPDGIIDTTFSTGVSSGTQVTAILVHPDGTTLVGGNFTQFGGSSHGYLAHVRADGVVDDTFTTAANGRVSALALERNEKILVGGAFTELGGQSHSRIGRLNADGTVDNTFTVSANEEVLSIFVQSDDKVLIGGRFTQVNGTNRSHLARLTAAGELDATFNPDPNDLVTGMAQQSDGKILVFGDFTSFAGVAQSHYVRLNVDGTVDTSFVLPASSNIDSMAAQSDGKILVGGIFSDAAVSGTAIIRVNSDGSFDSTFTPVRSNLPAHLVLDGSGHVFAAGGFTTFMAEPRRYIARFTNPTPATHTLEVGAGGALTWTLSGAMPVPTVVYFEASADGTAWTDLGHGSLVAGVWTLASPALPVGTTHLRAHGIVPTNGSDSSAIEAHAVISTTVGAPTITASPASQTVTAGGDLNLSVTATGTGTLTYQWKHDNVDIAGATSATLTISSIQVSQGGSYTVVVSNATGSVESGAAIVTVTPAPASSGRLLNLSTRALVGTDANVLIPGFVISGSGSKEVLIRAVGPTLTQAPYNLTNVLADPQIVLKRWNASIQPNGAYEDVATNNDWMSNTNADQITSTAADVGAFGINDSHEAALLLSLAPGQYTVVTSGVSSTTGIAIVELYDADDTASGAMLTNLSNRGFAGIGNEVMIPGFVISPEGPKTILLRAVGPTLASQYGVTGTMADPKLTLYRHETTEVAIATQDNWGENANATEVAETAQDVGAFPLATGSADAALVMTLQPGVYSAIGSSADGQSTGVILVELYVVP